MKCKTLTTRLGAAAGLFACVATASAMGGLGGAEPLTTTRVASGLAYPVFVTHAPGDTDRLFIVQKGGKIRILDLNTGDLLSSDYLNITSLVTGGSSTNDERGLLGLAFHPNYNENGYFYVNYTGPSNGDTVVARYQVSDSDPNRASASTATTIMQFNQPFGNHNGGWIGFGPDGYLYIATGDGGSGNDPGNRAQDITNQPLGKMLRIDPSVEEPATPPYTIPSDNPFVGVTGDDEIWSYGLRNPWRNSFDRVTGDLYIADVGQNAREEVNVQPAKSIGGENYGWRCKEGNICTGLSGCSCSSPSLTDPVHVYTHSQGFSITGGYVYRGCAIPTLDGTYFFADYVLQRIWSFKWDGADGTTDFVTRTSELSPSVEGFTINQISSFGEDANGEIYIVDQGSGTSGQVFKIIPEAGEVVCGGDPCVGDLDEDGVVGAADLAGLLAAWGACEGCPADLDGDGMVGPADLAGLLAAWGDCP